ARRPPGRAGARSRHPGARRRRRHVRRGRVLLPRVGGDVARPLGERRLGLPPAAHRRDAREAPGRRSRPAPRPRRGGRAARLRDRGGSETMIRFAKLRKVYGSMVAVDDLSLKIAPGEVFGFLGPNGAGKTTTIRMMIGLLAPTSGTVFLGGHDIGREPEGAKALTGYLADHPFLYDKLSGREFVRFVGGLYAVPAAQLRRRTGGR